jgi:hypothetical protein
MTRFLLAGAAVLATMTGAALAQSSGQTATQETTTITQPAAVAPVTVSSSETNGSAVRADGDQTATRGSAFTDSSGAKSETTITNTSYPLTGMITTKKTTTSVVNGIATETVTTTNTYPPSAMIPPQVSTATRTYVVGTK